MTGSGWITVEQGLRLHYEVSGAGPETLVLPGAIWAADYAPLASVGRLLCYDQRGRGRSDADPEAAHIWTDYEARDLETVRRAMGLQSFALLGWSYLGGVAALYASTYPAYVSRLVLVCPIQPRFPAPYDLDPDLELRIISHRVPLEQRERLGRLREQGLEASDPAAFCREHSRVQWLESIGRPEGLETILSDLCAYPNEWPGNQSKHWQLHFPDWSWQRDWRVQVAQTPVPTLVIHGREDLIPLESSREWAATLPNARLLVLPEVGHFPHLEAPEAFFSAVAQFLAGAWPEAAEHIIA